MPEKYIPDFDPDAFLQELAEEKQVTKKEALAMCRKAVPKEAYFQKKVINGLKKQFPDAYIAKIAQGMYSKLQGAAIEKIKNAGGTAGIVTYPEEAAEIIDSWRNGNGQKETD